MRRVLSGAAVLILTVGAALAVWALAVPKRDGGGYSWGGRDSLSRIHLDADRHVKPERVAPGGVVRYRFTVTNTGREPVRHLAVRSERPAGPNADPPQPVMSVEDPSCWAGAQVSCLLTRLGPGERRDVEVTVRTFADETPGERLSISTFVGRFAAGPADTLAFEVSGQARTTTGRLVAPGPHQSSR